MKIYTSYFANTNKIPLNFILFSIAGKTPEWFPGKSLKIFAPRYEWWKEWKSRFSDNLESDEAKDFYTKMYTETVLSKIEIPKIKKFFDNLKNVPCLMCYERPEKFCHRHLVADFLNKNGFFVTEY